MGQLLYFPHLFHMGLLELKYFHLHLLYIGLVDFHPVQAQFLLGYQLPEQLEFHRDTTNQQVYYPCVSKYYCRENCFA